MIELNNEEKKKIEEDFDNKVLGFKESMGKIYEIMGNQIKERLNGFTGLTETDNLIELNIKIRMERDALKAEVKRLKSGIQNIITYSKEQNIKNICEVLLK